MKKINFSLIIIIIILVISCKKENINNYHIHGVAQKGPFICGSNIIISELDGNLNPTGKTYFTTIIDDKGAFDIPDVEFASSYVQLMVDGYYFH